MKINLVCVEDSIITLGFRKIASYIKSLNPETSVFFLPLGQNRTLLRILTGHFGDVTKLEDCNNQEIQSIAEALADSDIVGFSCMTGYAEVTKALIKKIRQINPKTYIIWGGIHPIIHPEDAVLHADAICTGEGEYSFKEFLSAFQEGRDYSETKNFWFNQNGNITRNDFLPLHKQEDFDQFPFMYYGEEDEMVFKKGKGFVPVTTSDYISFNGTTYTTIWSIGCPYECTYCGNTVFIENDKNYRKLRHPSVEYLIAEVKDALKKHPYLSTVMFYDDSFMAIPKVTLEKFAQAWKKEIGIPFVVMGVIPSFVKEEKFEILVEAGMNRVRMGIQSGSDRTLEFFKRPNKEGLIPHAASVIASYSKYMIPAAYDIIVDNPVENRDDVVATLEMIYDLARPFTLEVFSLKIIPNTAMERDFFEHGIDHTAIDSNYLFNAPTFSNGLIYLLSVFRPPRWLFNLMLKKVKAYKEEQSMYPIFFFMCRSLWLVKRACSHMRVMDFSTISGRMGWICWRLGLVKFWRNFILPKPIIKKKSPTLA
jgi:anaerobic magnesium-protoporphyrin IX monomethyl ester cyclase